MSQENVEIVRRVYEAVAQRDDAALLALYDPDVEFDPARSPLGQIEGGGARRGYDALREWFREWHQAWENVAYDCVELIDVGDEQVVSIVTMRARGRTSGLSIEQSQNNVWTIRGSKVVRVVWFPTREEAVDAVGLREC